MTYNIDVTASRIKAAREASGYTLAQVAERCGVQQYQTVSKWEKGNSVPSIENLFKLCELFNCELGYLLGEHEGKTRAATDIHEKTGLSFRAIDELEQMKEKNQWYALQGLNTLLEESVCLTLDNIGKYFSDNRGYYIEAQDGARIGMETIHLIDVQQCLVKLREKYQAN